MPNKYFVSFWPHQSQATDLLYSFLLWILLLIRVVCEPWPDSLLCEFTQLFAPDSVKMNRLHLLIVNPVYVVLRTQDFTWHYWCVTRYTGNTPKSSIPLEVHVQCTLRETVILEQHHVKYFILHTQKR